MALNKAQAKRCFAFWFEAELAGRPEIVAWKGKVVLMEEKNNEGT